MQKYESTGRSSAWKDDLKSTGVGLDFRNYEADAINIRWMFQTDLQITLGQANNIDSISWVDVVWKNTIIL